MCIIVIKEKGVNLPSETVLKKCFFNNPDGAGFMYNKGGKVIIQKGYMKYKTFKKALDKVVASLDDVKNTGMVFHFRITTQGGTNPQNCHPFPVSNEESDLQATYFETDLGVAHNGIISLTSDYSNYYSNYYKQLSALTRDSHLSDTQIFIRDYLYPIYMLNPDFYWNSIGLDLIEKLIESKMCFMNGDGDIEYVGSFTIDKDIIYSNTSYSYKKTTYKNTNKKSTGVSNALSKYSYNTYDDYYDDDDYYPFSNNTYTTTKTKYLKPIEVDAYWYDADGDGDVIEAGKGGIDFNGYVYDIDKESNQAILASSQPVVGVWKISEDGKEDRETVIEYSFNDAISFKLVD